MKTSKGGTPVSVSRRRFQDALKARRALVDCAISFELALVANKKKNTRAAELVVDQALDALGVATRKYLRVTKRKS